MRYCRYSLANRVVRRTDGRGDRLSQSTDQRKMRREKPQGRISMRARSMSARSTSTGSMSAGSMSAKSISTGQAIGAGQGLARLDGDSRERESDDGEQEEEAQRGAQHGHDPLCRGAIDLHATSHIDYPRIASPTAT